MIYSENYCWKGPACSHSRFLIVILLMSDMNEQVTKFCFGDTLCYRFHSMEFMVCG